MSKFIFKNYGGRYQLRIQNAEDLENIQTLDEALWAATSVPIGLLNCDRKFASYLDTDQNGRIRTDELKSAQAWLFQMLKGYDRLAESTDVLRLDDIDTSHPEGQKLRSSAERILGNLNTSGAKEVSLAQVRDLQTIMANSANNGDGVITPEAADDPELGQFIVTVMETIGSTPDVSGKLGIIEEQLNTFFNEAEAYLSWRSRGEIPEGKNTTEVMFWGTETPRAYDLVLDLENKIEEYFIQCAMVRFDERTESQMKLRQKELEEMDFTDREKMEERLKNGPLAPLSPEGILHVKGTINPLYAKSLLNLKENVLRRAIGTEVKHLTREEWDKVKTIFAPYRDWIESKKGVKVEKLGVNQLHTYIDGTYKKRLSELIAKDLAVAEELGYIHKLEKVILYQRWLVELANNFVSFANLYNPEVRSLFEAGTLIIDGKEITFTMKIQDREAHKKTSANSYMYLLYVEVVGRQDKDIKFEIVSAVTSGDSGRLRIGKRGIFFTRDGKEWDAQVKDILANPISIWESLKAPFLQLTTFIRNQAEKFGKSRQAKTGAVPGTSSIVRDLLLGGGIAVAALGSSFAYITKTLSQVKPFHILIAFAGIIVIILLPNIIMGFLKLRKRDLSVILEAGGCAVNLKMRLGINLGRLFTHMPRLPKGSIKERRDMVAESVRKFGYSSSNLKRLIIIAFVTFLVTLGIIHLLIKYLISKRF